MLAASPFDPGLVACGSALLLLGLVSYLFGGLLVPRTLVADDWLTRDAARLISGLLFVSGLAATWCLQRFCFVTMIPVLQIACVLWVLRKTKQPPEPLERAPKRFEAERWWSLAAIVVFCIGFEWWNTGWQDADGSLRIIHRDLGYFAQTVLGLMESHVADGWSASLGAQTTAVGAAKDTWYHWGPMWLAVAVRAVTNLPPLAALLHVVATTMDIALVLVAGAIVRALTGMSARRSLLVGIASLVSVQMVRLLGVRWFDLSAEAGTMQHGRFSLAYSFSYKFEGAALLLALLCWLRRQPVLASVILACAAISSPHAVAMGGVTAGVMGTMGALTKQRHIWRTSLVIIGILLAVWGGLHVLFGVGLPKASDQHLVAFNVDSLRLGVRRGLMESCMALVLGALSLPGILHLIFARDDRSTPESKMLGWMALSGIVGSFVGFRLLDGVADNLHFIFITHAVLVMPVGIWGAARMLTGTQRFARYASLTLILVCTGMGIADLCYLRSQYAESPWKIDELAPLKEALRGRPFGYFAAIDRPWWLPKHSTVAALLDTRCTRLQEIDGEYDAAYARYYGSTRPYELVPPSKEETADEWSLRFARKLGIECVIEFGGEKLPATVKAKAREIASVPHAKLYELVP
jgi:hypothetical protein